MIRVLFVCLGNICRSPMAEAVFYHKVKAVGLEDQIEVDSAGTGDWHVGDLPHMGTRKVLKQHEIEHEHFARVLTTDDFSEFDYVLTMDDANLRTVRRMGGQKARPFMEYAAHRGVPEVPDPYFTGGFDYVYELIDEAADGLLDAIRQEHGL